MDKTALKDAWAEVYAWLKSVPGILWGNFVASSIKTKGVIAVLVAIAGMWGLDKLPSRSQVAGSLPDYATRSDVRSVQQSLASLTADLERVTAKLDSVESHLAKPAPAPVTTGSISKKRK